MATQYSEAGGSSGLNTAEITVVFVDEDYPSNTCTTSGGNLCDFNPLILPQYKALHLVGDACEDDPNDTMDQILAEMKNQARDCDAFDPGGYEPGGIPGVPSIRRASFVWEPEEGCLYSGQSIDVISADCSDPECMSICIYPIDTNPAAANEYFILLHAEPDAFDESGSCQPSLGREDGTCDL
jgi:hypothetical protein